MIEIRKRRTIAFEGAGVKADNNDALRSHIVFEENPDFAQRYSARALHGVSVGARADGGERNRGGTMLAGQLKHVAVTLGQKLCLPMSSAMPDWAYGVDDRFCRQSVGRSDSGFAGRTACQAAAFFKQLRPCCPVNRSIDSAATEKRGIRGVDNGIDTLKCDVTPYDLDSPRAVLFSAVRLSFHHDPPLGRKRIPTIVASMRLLSTRPVLP